MFKKLKEGLSGLVGKVATTELKGFAHCYKISK